MTSTLYSAKAQRGRRSKNCLIYEETFCLRGSFNFAHLFHFEFLGKINGIEEVCYGFGSWG